MTVAVKGRCGAVQLPHRHQSDTGIHISKKPTASIFRVKKDLETWKLKVVGTLKRT
jgi:hypothetical protein